MPVILLLYHGNLNTYFLLCDLHRLCLSQLTFNLDTAYIYLNTIFICFNIICICFSIIYINLDIFIYFAKTIIF